MSRSFAKLYWGILLVLLNFKVNQFDVFPDGIGFLLIASGCSDLSFYASCFNQARQWCYTLFVLWIFGFARLGDMGVLHLLITTAFSFAMIWALLGGIAEYSSNRGRLDFAGRAETWRLLYVLLLGTCTFFALTAPGQQVDSSLAICLFGGMMFLMLMILKLIHEVKTQLAETEPAMRSFEV